MKTIDDLVQGTPEWHAHRAQHRNASDAPAMMGHSKYTSRTELLHQMHTGVSPEVDARMQALFDEGHRCEALARPLAEELIGEPVYPVTGVDGLLSASFDGLTMTETVAFEHKMLNDALRAVMVDGCTGADLPMMYRVQMEQQCMISGCERILFMASKWTKDGLPVEVRHCWYEPDQALADQIRAGWAQFEADLANYVPAEVIDKPVARVVTSLPAVSVQVSGALVVRDNFPKFETALRHFIEVDLIVKPETDQDFADLTLQIQALKDAESALDAAETQMLSQVEQVDTIKRTKEMLRELARDHRLAAQKRLDARKLEIKGEIVASGVTAFREHMEALNKRLGKPYMPEIAANFGGVIKNLRTVDSLRNAVNTELARVKILANETADRIDANLKHLRETASEHVALFPDTATIVLKAPDDLQALVANRINEHKAAEQKKQDELREQIRKEEADRLEREAKQKVDDEAEAKRKADAAIAIAATPAPAPAPAPAAQMETAQPAARTFYRSAPPASAPQSAAPVDGVTAEQPTMKLGDICARLNFTVNADFLADLGFTATVERGARLYRPSDFTRICAAIVRHVSEVAASEVTA